MGGCQYMHASKEQQLFFMRWAIQLGEKGRCTAPPNPWVGCVLVKDGEIIAEGYHAAAGKPHAEIVALEKAGPLAKGATAYVSLEPCSHHGRTAPCVHALIAAGIKQVIIPLLDPDPRVSGTGVAALREAGIDVVVGMAQEEASRSLAPYLFQRRTKRPYCLLKSAMSLDGRTAAADGTSQWITGEEARRDVHFLRAESQAILVGSRTALTDNPRLTVRDFPYPIKQPLRVLLDRQGRVPAQGPLADMTLAPTLVFTSSSPAKDAWERCGAEVYFSPAITLKDILEELGKREIIQLLVEGGSALHAAFLKENLVNQFTLYMGNCLLGSHGHPLIPDFPIATLSEAPRWSLESVRRFGNDLRLDYLLF